MTSRCCPGLVAGISVFLVLPIFLTGVVQAHVEQSKEQPAIALDQKLGQQVPLDATFNDEHGRSVNLRQVIPGPTILALVYYSCPNVCSLLLQHVAEALNRMPAKPGSEYSVVAVSFDENEKPDLAMQRKTIYLNMIEKPFPPEAWKFLTGDRDNILRLTRAVGFGFRRQGNDFEHPVSLIILSAEGKITRYLYGTDILPFDLKMAILEASEGKVTPTIARVLRVCFSYDPKSRRYVFNTLKVTGIVTIVFAGSFLLFLLVKGRKIRRKDQG